MDTTPIPPIDAALSAVRSPVALARASWAAQRYEMAAERGDWLKALEYVHSVAERLAGTGAEAPAWQEVLYAATWVAARAGRDAAPMFLRLFDLHAEQAWPGKDAATLPWPLAHCFAGISGGDLPPGGEKVAAVIAARYPAFPLGPYACGHFLEIAALQAPGAVSPDAARATADHFRRAAARADELDRPSLAAHARLRAGVLLLYSGADRDAGRKLLVGLHLDDLSLDEHLWYAYGMVHSPFWLDRIRSADILDDLALAAADTRRPTSRRTAVDLDLLRDLTRRLVNAPTYEVQPAEEDRLIALAERLLDPITRRRVLEDVDVRARLRDLRTTPLDAADEVTRLLAGLAERSPESWRAVFDHFTGLRAAFDATDAPTTALQRTGADPRFELARAVMDALDALTHDNADRLTGALTTLRELTAAADDDPTRLKPLALLWPRLLPHLSGANLNAQATALALPYCASAPAPSYGWWLLAAHFAAADLMEAAHAAARRALTDGARADDALRDDVIGRLIEDAAGRRDLDTLRLWLHQI